MGRHTPRSAAEARQARVAKAVWGLLFLGMGVLFLMDEAGEINMKGPALHRAEFAVDGDRQTRWSSGWSDPQSITVDLGSVVEITRVTLAWESAFGRAYRIETSDDGSTFTPVREVADGDGEVDDLEVQARGRYLRLVGTSRATQYGYSLWELEVYGPQGLLSANRPVRVTSSERLPLWPLYWSRYWPMVLIGLGLPPLLAPKDGGDQVLGLAFAATGVFFQLQRLGMVRWTFAQAWPVLLILGGAILVIQALGRQGAPSVGASDGPAAPPGPAG
jgi:hypothetical protein